MPKRAPEIEPDKKPKAKRTEPEPEEGLPPAEPDHVWHGWNDYAAAQQQQAALHHDQMTTAQRELEEAQLSAMRIAPAMRSGKEKSVSIAPIARTHSDGTDYELAELDAARARGAMTRKENAPMYQQRYYPEMTVKEVEDRLPKGVSSLGFSTEYTRDPDDNQDFWWPDAAKGAAARERGEGVDPAPRRISGVSRKDQITTYYKGIFEGPGIGTFNINGIDELQSSIAGRSTKDQQKIVQDILRTYDNHDNPNVAILTEFRDELDEKLEEEYGDADLGGANRKTSRKTKSKRKSKKNRKTKSKRNAKKKSKRKTKKSRR